MNNMKRSWRLVNGDGMKSYQLFYGLIVQPHGNRWGAILTSLRCWGSDSRGGRHAKLEDRETCENKIANDEQKQGDLGLVEEQRDWAQPWLAYYQYAATLYCNKKVKYRHFNEADLVHRRVLQNTQEWKAYKLSTNWKGTYRVNV